MLEVKHSHVTFLQISVYDWQMTFLCHIKNVNWNVFTTLLQHNDLLPSLLHIRFGLAFVSLSIHLLLTCCVLTNIPQDNQPHFWHLLLLGCEKEKETQDESG